MIRISVSPSKLDQFVKFINEDYGGTITEDKLIDYLTKRPKPTQAQNLGLAYHSIIENGHKPYEFVNSGKQFYKVVSPRFGEQFFTREQVLPSIKLKTFLKDATFEVKAKKEIRIKNYLITSRQRIDAINGLHLHEFKTTSSKYVPRYEDYYKSIQWRFYLLTMYDALRVNYSVFHFQNTKSKDRLFKGESRKVTPYHFIMNREEQNESLVLDYLSQFIAFCERKGLIDYLK